MIFVDSNIPMYLVGGAHRHKDRSLVLVTGLVRMRKGWSPTSRSTRRALHRYTAIDRPDAIDPAFDVLDAIVDDVLGFGMREYTPPGRSSPRCPVCPRETHCT